MEAKEKHIGPAWLQRYLSPGQRVAYNLARLPGRLTKNYGSTPAAAAARRKLVVLQQAMEKGDSATLADFDVPAAERLDAAGLTLMVQAARMQQQGTLIGFLWDAGATTERKGVMRALDVFMDMRSRR